MKVQKSKFTQRMTKVTNNGENGGVYITKRSSGADENYEISS